MNIVHDQTAFSLFLSVSALLAAVASLAYAIVANRRTIDPRTMKPAERACWSWNQSHRVGQWVRYTPEHFDPVVGYSAVRTRSKAYVKGGTPMVDVEHFGTVEIYRRVDTMPCR